MLVLASAEAVAGITAGATLLAGIGLALVTVRTKRLDLEHARELADLADLRALLDESAVALNGAMQPFSQAELIVAPRPVPLDVGRASDLVDALVTELGEHAPVTTLRVRLGVRLGTDDPITAEFQLASEAIHGLWRMFAKECDPAKPLSAKQGDVAAALTEFSNATMAFLDAAVDRAGTVPTRGGKATA